MKIARFIFFIGGFLLIVTGSILLCNGNKSMGMITVKAGLGISFAGCFCKANGTSESFEEKRRTNTLQLVMKPTQQE